MDLTPSVRDHSDYTILQSTNPEFLKSIVRVNIHRSHRQMIQWISPRGCSRPGPSRAGGYRRSCSDPTAFGKEAHGSLLGLRGLHHQWLRRNRAIALPQAHQAAERTVPSWHLEGGAGSVEVDRSNGKETKEKESVFQGGRSLREITLNEPIRYAAGDRVEKWLNSLLCLDATLPSPKTHPRDFPTRPHASFCTSTEIHFSLSIQSPRGSCRTLLHSMSLLATVCVPPYLDFGSRCRMLTCENRQELAR